MNTVAARIRLTTQKLRDWANETVIPWAKEYPKKAALVAASTITFGAILWGSAVIINGAILGLLMAGAIGALLFKMSKSKDEIARQAYETVMEYPLVADVGVTLLALAVFPNSVTGYIGAAFAGLIASAFLMPEGLYAKEEQQQSREGLQEKTA